ncbi:MAG: amino acid dehydrogenase [Myxococcales bacterium]|nr:amino acid dehydrogenase [Myxococcales bacterium]
MFDHPDFDDHRHVSLITEPPLRAIIAIHRDGPFGGAGGGCRIYPYPSAGAAVTDALRLSRAMTYKLAITGLPAGGAKCVVIADTQRDKNDALLAAIGRAVHRLGGRYIIAEDVGTTPDDMDRIAEHTPYVSRRRVAYDTARSTADGVFVGLCAAVRHRFGSYVDLADVRIAVQGVGRVGERLCELLKETGATLFVADVDGDAARRVALAVNAEVVSPQRIHTLDVDVFAPCALGSVIDDNAIEALRCSIVAGSANNPLADDRRHAEALRERGILYAPDFVISAGGVLGAAHGDDEARLATQIAKLGETLELVFERAEQRRISTYVAAVELAKRRLGEPIGREDGP